MGNFVIVGGSSGIGREITRLLSSDHDVTVISRNAKSEDFEDNIVVKNADVLEDDLEQHLPESIDGLVYCPGSINLKPFRSLDEDDYLSDFKINVLGAVRCIKAAYKPLKKGKNPSILLFSTVAVGQGMNFHSSVSAAKGAVEGLTRSLAAEFAPAIRVNAIAPSLIDTPLAGKLLGSEKSRKAAEERHPLNNYGKPEDVAALAQFLLSSSAAFVSGQVYGIDGGLSSLRV